MPAPLVERLSDLMARTPAALLFIVLPVVAGVLIVVYPFGWAVTGVMNDVKMGVGAGMAVGVGVALRLGRARSGVAVGIAMGSLVGIVGVLLAGLIPGNGTLFICPPLVALSVGMIDGIRAQRLRGFRECILVSMGMATLVSIGLSPALGGGAVVFTLGAGTVVALMLGMMRAPRRTRLGVARPPLLLLLTVIAFYVFVTWLLWVEEVRPNTVFGIEWMAPLLIGCLIVVPAIMLAFGCWLAIWIRPRLSIYRQLTQYLSVMWVPLGAFVLGYSIIIVVFAGFYGMLARFDDTAFSGLPENFPGVGNWIFYSFFTATAQDYNSIVPVSPLARAITSVQLIVSIGWAVVVFAAVMTHVQPQMQRIAQETVQDERD